MKLYFLLAPAFLDLPLAVIRQIRSQRPAFQACGLVTGPAHVHRKIALADPKIFPLDRLDELERDWLETPCDENRLQEFQRLLGTDAIRRIQIGDRQLGSAWVFGAHHRGSELIDRILRDNVEAPRRYLVGLLSYCFDVLKKESPDIVFCYAVAGAPALALAEACRVLEIPFRRLSSARIGSRMIIDDEPQGMLGPVRRLYQRARQEPKLVAPYSTEAREWLERFRSAPSLPEYALESRKKAWRNYRTSALLLGAALGLLALCKGVAKGNRSDLRTVHPARNTRLVTSVSGFRARMLSRSHWFRPAPDVKASFAYYPLQVEPEASTLVMAPMHTNQLAVIEALSKSLPLNMTLVVKEHLPMLGRRPSNFYRQIARMPGVVLVSPFADNFDLIRRASVICVITGTAAWEGLLLGRPVIIIGNSPYLAIDSAVVHCPDLSRLHAAVAESLGRPGASEQEIVDYVSALFALSIEVPHTLLWGKVTKEVLKSNMQTVENLANALTADFQ
jgi:hypothetical protein